MNERTSFVTDFNMSGGGGILNGDISRYRVSKDKSITPLRVLSGAGRLKSFVIP